MPRGENGNTNKYDGFRVLTVTYRRKDEKVIVVKEGIGKDYVDALAHADAQLKPGRWQRVAVSQPTSILADVKNAGKVRKTLNAQRKGEGDWISVAKPRIMKQRR